MEPDGYLVQLAAGWRLTVSTLAGTTLAWLTNPRVDSGFYESTIPGETLIDLARLGYVPSVYHDGNETPPLVLFHAARRDLVPYVWEPASGRLYQAGEAETASLAQTHNG